jgi:hypothetical protein
MQSHVTALKNAAFCLFILLSPPNPGLLPVSIALSFPDCPLVDTFCLKGIKLNKKFWNLKES